MLLSALEQRNKGPLDDFWYRPTWMGGGSGNPASPEEAMGLSAWWNGIGILAGTMGSLPCRLYRRVGDNAREPARDDPRFWMMFRKPNRWQTAFEWREMAQGHVVTRGNHYSRILRDRLGRASELIPLHPDRVTMDLDDPDRPYVVRSRNGLERYRWSEMYHVRGLGGDGFTGLSVARLAAMSLGYSLGLEKHGAELMDNKARPGGVLSTDQVLKKESRLALSEQWDQMYTGGGIGKTAVLDAGLTWQQVGFSAEDAQFLESRKFQVSEIARWLNLPPHMLKDLERSTFSNIEHQAIEFVVHTMRPWAERWEQRLDESLLDESERETLFFKFSLEALLRGDSAARAQFYQQLFQMAALSPNEIRALEDMNPVDGGDQRFVQVNLMTLDQAGQPFDMMPGGEGGNDEGDERAVRSLPGVDRRALEQRSLRQRRRLAQVHQRLLTSAAGRLVQREVQDIGRLIEAADGDVDDFLRRLERFAENLPSAVRSIMGPLLSSYIELVADAAAEEVDIDELDGTRVGAWSSAYVDSFTVGHTSETVGRLTDTVTVAEGDPMGNARSMLDRWSENRAVNIGLREAITAGGGIATTVYAMAGFGAVWRTVGETCPYCKRLEGRTVAAGGRFLNEGDTIEPTDGSEPMTVRRGISHPQAHDGCDCTVSAWR